MTLTTFFAAIVFLGVAGGLGEGQLDLIRLDYVLLLAGVASVVSYFLRPKQHKVPERLRRGFLAGVILLFSVKELWFLLKEHAL